MKNKYIFSQFLLILFLFLSVPVWAQDNAALDQSSDSVSMVLGQLDFKNADITEVLKAVAEKSGLTIIGTEGAQGKVTLFLKNVDVQDALRIILDTNQLAYVQDRGVVRIMTAENFQAKYGYSFGQGMQTKIVNLAYIKSADVISFLDQAKSPSGKIFISDKSESSLVLMDNPEAVEVLLSLIRELDVPLQTETIELSAAKAGDVLPQLQDVLSKNVGKIELDETGTRLVVTDTMLNMKNIKARIRELDKVQKEVFMETKIFQIILNDEHDKGVDWEAIVSDYHSLPYDHFDPSHGDAAFQMSFGTVSDEDYAVLLDALDTVGVINTIFNSRVVAINNKKSELAVKTIQSVVNLPNPGGISLDDQRNVQFSITPTRGDDGYFNFHIIPGEQIFHIRWEEYLKEKLLPDGVAPNGIDVKIKEGETAVIGGLFKNVPVSSMRKFPLLGDLPLLGFVFRNQREVSKNSEIIIFLTPKMVAN